MTPNELLVFGCAVFALLMVGIGLTVMEFRKLK